MPETLKVLGQQNPSAATLTALYTVPASTSAVVSTITVCNRSATATSFRLSVAVAGAADNNIQYIAYDMPIEGNGVRHFTDGITLATTDVLRCFATLATLSFNAYGSEIT